MNDRFSDLTNEAEPLADRAADASRSAFVPRPRATDAGRAPQRRVDAVSFLDRARWSWDAAGGPALAARSPADIVQAADPVDVATGDVLLLLATPWRVMAIGRDGPAWRTGRLAIDGLRLDETDGSRLVGVADPDSPEPRDFVIDLQTGSHRGGAVVTS